MNGAGCGIGVEGLPQSRREGRRSWGRIGLRKFASGSNPRTYMRVSGWINVSGFGFRVYGVWCMVYGVWCMVYGVGFPGSSVGK